MFSFHVDTLSLASLVLSKPLKSAKLVRFAASYHPVSPKCTSRSRCSDSLAQLLSLASYVT